MTATRNLLLVWLVVAFAGPGAAMAQPAGHHGEAAVHVAAVRSSEFETTDVGAGGRLTWLPSGWLGLEAELTWYPQNFPEDPGFSRGRVEGLFGATVGPAIGAIRPFAKLRPGFVRFRQASEPIACIAIFPPPLACRLSDGRTLLAIDVGGGLDVRLGRRAVVRVDASDRAVRYEGPVIVEGRRIDESDYYGHDFRFSVGVGVRF